MAQQPLAKHRDAPWFTSLCDTQRHDLLAFEGNAVALRLAARATSTLSPYGLDLSDPLPEHDDIHGGTP